jgi:RNA polymerase sigma-70 factor, ECF subfamily
VPETQGPLSPESDVLRRAQAGDPNAFGELMREHYEPIFRLVMSIIGNEHDARDVCQEVWLTVWKNLSKFRGESRFTTWLHPIAVRRSLDHLRRRKKWLARFLPFLSDGEGSDDFVSPAAPEPADASDPRGELERAERDQRFERALGALPPKHRAVLALREVEGLSYDEIAQAMNCRPGTVMSRLYNARRLLVRKLRDMPCE